MGRLMANPLHQNIYFFCYFSAIHQVLFMGNDRSSLALKNHRHLIGNLKIYVLHKIQQILTIFNLKLIHFLQHQLRFYGKFVQFIDAILYINLKNQFPKRISNPTLLLSPNRRKQIGRTKLRLIGQDRDITIEQTCISIANQGKHRRRLCLEGLSHLGKFCQPFAQCFEQRAFDFNSSYSSDKTYYLSKFLLACLLIFTGSYTNVMMRLQHQRNHQSQSNLCQDIQFFVNGQTFPQHYNYHENIGEIVYIQYLFCQRKNLHHNQAHILYTNYQSHHQQMDLIFHLRMQYYNPNCSMNQSLLNYLIWQTYGIIAEKNSSLI